MTASSAAAYENYEAFYKATYEASVAAAQQTGRFGAQVLRIRQPAGDWSDAATPDLVFQMLTTTHSVQGEFDCGAGLYRGAVRPGNLYVVPPGTAASIALADAHECLVVALPYRGLLSFAGEDSGLPTDGDFGACHSRVFADRELARLIGRISPETGGECPLYADGLLLQIVSRLGRLRGTVKRTAQGGLAPWQVRRVTEYLEAHLAEAVSIGQLAELVGLSPFHFARAFKISTGSPPHAYLRDLRCRRAQMLLATSRMSVTEIALEVGYGSSQTLARLFQAEVGAAPRSYRRLQQDQIQ